MPWLRVALLIGLGGLALLEGVGLRRRGPRPRLDEAILWLALALGSWGVVDAIQVGSSLEAHLDAGRRGDRALLLFSLVTPVVEMLLGGAIAWGGRTETLNGWRRGLLLLAGAASIVAGAYFALVGLKLLALLPNPER